MGAAPLFYIQNDKALNSKLSRNTAVGKRDAQPRFYQLAVFYEQRDDSVDFSDGNGETYSGIGSGRTVNCRINANQPTCAVEQRSP